MNIIFVSNNMAKARTLTLRQAVLLLTALVLLVAGLTMALILPQANGKHYGVQDMLPLPIHFSLRSQEHLDALAMQLGEIQARVIRLDALSERLSKLAGVKEQEQPAELPGRGGPLINPHSITEAELQQKITELTAELERRSDRLSLIEALLLQHSLQKDTLPNAAPIDVGYNSSSYGWRVDPFTGQMAFHEGLDFTAEAGTPIYAAAGGIVSVAEQMPDYGKIIKIDHGSGIETRYAHASELLVKPGERVERGQMIARVGNSGRSTGAHLHFEVRLNGAALDPRKYLQQARAN